MPSLRIRHLAFLPIALGSCSTSSDAVEIVQDAPGDIKLRANYFRQDYNAALPTLILVHQPGTDRSRADFESVWEPLRSAGYNLLAPDLRSHGTSDVAGTVEELALDLDGYPVDILTWIDFLASRQEAGDPVDIEHLGLIAMGTSASIGTSVLGYGHVRCLVAMSPTLEEVNAFASAIPPVGDDDDSASGDDDDSAGGDLPAGLDLHDALWGYGTEHAAAAAAVSILRDATDDPTGELAAEGDLRGIEILWENDANKDAITGWCSDKL